MEIWAPIPGFPAYEVSDLGRARRVLCGHCGARLAHPIHLRGRPDKDGYRRFTLAKGRKRHECRAARLVLLAFRGPPPGDSHEAAHGDGNNRNDRLSNLRWATRGENEIDKIAHGTRIRGAQMGTAKLSESDVHQIRRLKAEGLSQNRIAKLTGATPGNVSNVVRRKSWRHVA